MAAKKGHIVERGVSEAARADIERIRRGSSKIVSGLDDDDVVSLAERVAQDKLYLQELRTRLTGGQLKDTGAIALAVVVKTSTALQALFLGGNLITDTGANALAVALKTSRFLRQLSCVRFLQIKDHGIIAIAESLIGNINLTHLWIRGNQDITDASIPALKKMVLSSHMTYMGEDPLEGTSVSLEARKEFKDTLRIKILDRVIPSKFFEKEKKYSAFISRHSHDGVSDKVAEMVKNNLGKGAFVDSGKFQHIDISQLLNELDDSKSVVLLLLRKDVMLMPVCLIELYHAIKNEIPIVIVVDEDEISMEETIEFVGEHLETELKEPGLELMKWRGVNVGEVGRKVSKMMTDAVRNNKIKRINANNGDLQTEIEQITKSINAIM